MFPRLVQLLLISMALFPAIGPATSAEVLSIGAIKAAGVFKYGNTASYSLAVRDLYPTDFDGDGNEEVIFAGFETQPNTPAAFDKTKLQIFGWSKGLLTNQTTKWLPGSSSLIEGTTDVAIGDFNGDGKKDFFTSAYSDMDYDTYEYSFINKGGYFERKRHSVGRWQHGLTVADINQDGFDDVVVVGYATVSPYFLGGPSGLTRYTPYEGYHYASDIEAGYFISQVQPSFVEVDAYADGVTNTDTLLKEAKQFYSGSSYGFELKAPLPAPSMGSSSHDIRALRFRINSDKLDDVIVFSRKSSDDGTWPETSTIQMLINEGSGRFIDVTSTKLVGFQQNSTVSYHPIVVDINSDKRMDIFVSGSDWEGTSNSTAILMGRTGGVLAEKFRASLSSLVKKPGVISTLVKTKKGYVIVMEYQEDGKAVVKYASLTVR